jgi:deoxyribose-phosphate aldolase
MKPSRVQDDTIIGMIDHTLLKPDAPEEDMRRICREALDYRFASVCLPPYYVKLAAGILSNPGIPVCTVVGFPLGVIHPGIKAREAGQAVLDGAVEIDMVINVSALKSGKDRDVLNDIKGVVNRCREDGALVKVILETALLNREEKERGCLLCVEAGADFVKTSTGFGPGGATKEDVELMKRVVGPHGLRVKAAGGIRTLEQARVMVDAGAVRLGTSRGCAIADEILESRT